MGRVCRDNRSGRLYVGYKGHAGRRIRKSARGCITDRPAERYVQELEVAERDTVRDIARGVYDGVRVPPGAPGLAAKAPPRRRPQAPWLFLFTAPKRLAHGMSTEEPR